MNYQVWKLEFSGNVHFGDGGLNTSRYVFSADTLFSALCIEALRMGQGILDSFVQMAKNNRFRISDGLPYIEDTYYLPKPMMRIAMEQDGNSIQKKALKKLEYIPSGRYTEYLSGKMDIKKESDFFTDHIGAFHMVEKTAISGNDQPQPYGIEVFRFRKGSGLYVCLEYTEDEVLDKARQLMNALQYSGLGGKLSSGYGKFGLQIGTIPKGISERLDWEKYQTFTSLSLSLPRDEELDEALADADYRLIKRSGFIASASYAAAFQKKKDLYALTTGSTFHHAFEGDIYDVSDGGRHPVYRYAKPMFLGVMQ